MDSRVLAKYQKAGKIAHEAYKIVVSKVNQGVSLSHLCAAGDNYIRSKNPDEINGGICHPTTVQLDHIVCNHAPGADDDTVVDGTQLLKIQVGAHVDGYGAIVGGNYALPGASSATLQLAKEASFVAQLAMKTIKPGGCNRDLVDAVESYMTGKSFKGVPGLLSHNHDRYDIQGPKCIDLFPKPSDRSLPGIIFEEGEVYTVEVWLTDSSNPEPLIASNLQPTLHQLLPTKSNSEASVNLPAYARVKSIVGTFPFHTRSLGPGEKGNIEVLRETNLLATYPPFVIEQPGRVAQCVISFVITETGVSILSPGMMDAHIL